MPESRDLAVSVEQALIQGDLRQLNAEQKVNYYLKVCESLGLNPYTKPFDYLMLNGREVLYATKNATDQLRSKHRVSITTTDSARIDDLFVVTASARAADGRTDSSIGAVNINGLKGDALANAMMKAETKAKRRVTLSLCGLGMLDETELETVRDSYMVEGPLPRRVDTETGEVLDEYEPQPPPSEDRDLVRSADDPGWQSWERVRDRAGELGVKVQAIRLGVDRHDLKAYREGVVREIRERERQLEALPRR